MKINASFTEDSVVLFVVQVSVMGPPLTAVMEHVVQWNRATNVFLIGKTIEQSTELLHVLTISKILPQLGHSTSLNVCPFLQSSDQ